MSSCMTWTAVVLRRAGKRNGASASSVRSTRCVYDASALPLCRPWTSSSTAVMAERERRGLADCSEAHRQCKAMGYTMGTELYLRCRTMIAQQDAAQTAATVQTINTVTQQQQSLTPLPPLPPPPRMVTCTSMGMGNMVTTNCQ